MGGISVYRLAVEVMVSKVVMFGGGGKCMYEVSPVENLKGTAVSVYGVRSVWKRVLLSLCSTWVF